MLVYKDAEEAAGLIAKYLKDGKKERRDGGKRKGRVDREHTFAKRAEKLLEFIKMDSIQACQPKGLAFNRFDDLHFEL